MGENVRIHWKRLYDLLFDKDRRPYLHVLHQCRKAQELRAGTFQDVRRRQGRARHQQVLHIKNPTEQIHGCAHDDDNQMIESSILEKLQQMSLANNSAPSSMHSDSSCEKFDRNLDHSTKKKRQMSIIKQQQSIFNFNQSKKDRSGSRSSSQSSVSGNSEYKDQDEKWEAIEKRLKTREKQQKSKKLRYDKLRLMQRQKS